VEELVFYQSFVGENHGLTISSLHITIQPFSLCHLVILPRGLPEGFEGVSRGLPHWTLRQPYGNSLWRVNKWRVKTGLFFTLSLGIKVVFQFPWRIIELQLEDLLFIPGLTVHIVLALVKWNDALDLITKEINEAECNCSEINRKCVIWGLHPGYYSNNKTIILVFKT